MDQEKLKTAYHETCHAMMAIIHDLKIGRISIKGTDKYRGVMSTEPPAREITNPREALREVRISLSGFVGEVMVSGKYSVFRGHPDLEGAIELVRDMMAFDPVHRIRTPVDEFLSPKGTCAVGQNLGLLQRSILK